MKTHFPSVTGSLFTSYRYTLCGKLIHKINRHEPRFLTKNNVTKKATQVTCKKCREIFDKILAWDNE